MSIPTNRRDFIKMGFFGTGTLLFLPSCLKNYTPWRFLTETEATCLIPVCEQIIPADEFGPGATYAGVIFYIDKQLDEIFISERSNYKKGIKAIQASCQEIHKKNFEDLDPEKQHEFLLLLENNELNKEHWDELNQSSFFRTIIDHTMQGFYGSPRHGGNKDYISYKILDLDYPYIVGQNRYRNHPL